MATVSVFGVLLAGEGMTRSGGGFQIFSIFSLFGEDFQFD